MFEDFWVNKSLDRQNQKSRCHTGSKKKSYFLNAKVVQLSDCQVIWGKPWLKHGIFIPQFAIATQTNKLNIALRYVFIFVWAKDKLEYYNFLAVLLKPKKNFGNDRDQNHRLQWILSFMMYSQATRCYKCSKRSSSLHVISAPFNIIIRVLRTK